MEENVYFLGISIICILTPIVFVLGFILYDMIKNGTSYGRKIPIPPKHLNPKYKNK